jgi:hypothetical protein
MESGRPKLYKSAKPMKIKIDEYFECCKHEHRPYTISGLCLHLGMTRETLRMYENDEIFSDTIKAAKCRVENYIEEKSLTGEINTTASIFNLKNNFGWSDRQDVHIEGEGIFSIRLPEGMNKDADRD